VPRLLYRRRRSIPSVLIRWTCACTQNSSPPPLWVRPLRERLLMEPTNQRLLSLQLRTTVKSRALVAGWLGCGSVPPPSLRIWLHAVWITATFFADQLALRVIGAQRNSGDF
jgi:hypothetical protein